MNSGWNLATLSLILVIFGSTAWSDEPDEPPTTRQPIKLPGMVIDLENRRIDLAATVCLDEGFLELVACTQGSKEHESIVAVAGRPMHIHTALLLLNANNGNPAMRKLVGETEKRWIDIPPRGDPIEAFFVFKDADGKMIERPVHDFITRSEEQAAPIGDVADRIPADQAIAKVDKFPSTFLFSGSQLRDNGPGPRTYLADLSGHVISIATFGDDLLCLPNVHSHLHGTLSWRVNPKYLPKVGTKITLRLRPKNDRKTGIKK